MRFFKFLYISVGVLAFIGFLATIEMLNFIPLICIIVSLFSFGAALPYLLVYLADDEEGDEYEG